MSTEIHQILVKNGTKPVSFDLPFAFGHRRRVRECSGMSRTPAILAEVRHSS